jgi:hypothetical protein
VNGYGFTDANSDSDNSLAIDKDKDNDDDSHPHPRPPSALKVCDTRPVDRAGFGLLINGQNSEKQRNEHCDGNVTARKEAT